MSDWLLKEEDPIDLSSAELCEAHVPVDDGVALRVMRWRPKAPAGEAEPLVFVAGWGSTILGWAQVVRAAAESRTVYYIESREKRSAKIDWEPLSPEHFTIARMAEDLRAAPTELGLDDGGFAVMGSSLGATSIIEALKGGGLKPRAAFVIGPNCHFPFPWWGRAIVAPPLWFYPPVMEVILFYLRHFRVDTKNEPQQMERYERTMRAADPERMKCSALGVDGYEIWSGLETIEAPLAIAYSPADKLHLESEIMRLVEAVPRPRLFTCPTNLFMHEAPIVGVFDRFLGDLPD